MIMVTHDDIMKNKKNQQQTHRHPSLQKHIKKVSIKIKRIVRQRIQATNRVYNGKRLFQSNHRNNSHHHSGIDLWWPSNESTTK